MALKTKKKKEKLLNTIIILVIISLITIMIMIIQKYCKKQHGPMFIHFIGKYSIINHEYNIYTLYD